MCRAPNAILRVDSLYTHCFMRPERIMYMRKIFSLLIAAIVLAVPASADEGKRKCLADRVLISNARIEDSLVGDELKFDILNNLAWSIAGIRFQYSVNAGSDQWQASLEHDEAIEVIDGIKPNQSVSISLNAAGIPKDVAPPLIVKIAILDVTDSQKRQMINDIPMPNWEKTPSPEVCK